MFAYNKIPADLIEEQRQADALDAMADLAEEQRQAMLDPDYWEWDGVEEISSEERNACDHYNERYTYFSGY